MKKKIIWIIVDLFTLAFGSAVFVTSSLSSSVDEDGAGGGVFLIVLGLLVRNWKKDLFQNKNDVEGSSNSESNKLDSNKILTIGLVVIFAFTLWSSNKGRIQGQNSRINDLENSIYSKY